MVHPVRPEGEDDDEEETEEEKDFRDDYVFDAYLLGFCDDVTRALAKKLFSDNQNESPGSDDAPEVAKGKLLAALADDDAHYSKDDWKTTSNIPPERIFLFPGAEAPSKDDDASELTYREIAQCDGCSERIVGTIHKCTTCFDFDVCQKCFPVMSKTHYDGQHHFVAEAAAPLTE